QSDAELPRHGDPRLAEPLLLQFAAIETTQRRITPHGVDRRLTPQKTQHRVALLREAAEALASAARVFARNQPHVTRQGLRTGKARRIAQEYFRGQSRHWTHTRMRHQAPGVRTRACVLT